MCNTGLQLVSRHSLLRNSILLILLPSPSSPFPHPEVTLVSSEVVVSIVVNDDDDTPTPTTETAEMTTIPIGGAIHVIHYQIADITITL